MKKIAIVDKIHADGIKLLEANPKFEYEIIEDLSKINSKFKFFENFGALLQPHAPEKNSAW